MQLVVIFVVSATLANGLLAGGDVDRWLVGMPAWQSVGVLGWANYSRLADLGNGFVLYPILAIGGTAFPCRSRDLHAPSEARARRGYSGLRGGGIGGRGTFSDI
jgi:hypothetical protein